MIEPLPELNTTIIGVLPEPIVGLLQQLINSVYVLMGGVVGFFIISFILKWLEDQKLKRKLNEIERIVKRIERKMKK